MIDFLNKLTAGVTANRLLTFSTSLASLGTTLAAIGGAFPVGQTQATIIAASGLLAALGNTLHFQRGAQKFDALTAVAVEPEDDGLEEALSEEDGLLEHPLRTDPPPDAGDKGEL